MQRHPFLAIVGASGSGKSSLVRAGLVPALAQAAPPNTPPADVFLFTPTAHPLEALASGLARGAAYSPELVRDLEHDPSTLLFFLRHRLSAQPDARPILVVDQFEELFTLCRGEAERQAFLDNLLLASAGGDAPARVVITLRADFYSHCAQYPDLRRALAQQQAYIGPMSATELRRAIEGPAHLGGWAFEPGLVDWILREAGDEPGVLPLLSHGLLETWQRRRGRTLTFQGYAASGGVQGAIAKTAETVFNHSLTPEQQPIARHIFLQLTELGEGTQDTRRQASLSELMRRPDDAPAVAAVLKILVEARLVTVDHDMVEVGHEALIREWPALRQWLAEDRDGLRLQRRLADAAQEWEALDRDPGALLRGARLAQTVEWANEHDSELNPLEQEYLTTSRAQAEGEDAENTARQQRELAAAQREAEAMQRLAAAEKQRADESGRASAQLRRRAVTLTGMVVVALLLAGVAVWLGGQARQAATTAQSNERLAFARELAAAASANLDVDPERSVLLALQAVAATYAADHTVTTEAEEALHSALQASRVARTVALSPDRPAAVAFSSNGQQFATTSGQGLVTVWDAASGQSLLTIPSNAGQGNHALAFSPDGRRLAASGPANTAQVWDAATGQPLFSLPGHTGPVLALAFSADGTRLASASADGTAKLWDASAGAFQYTVLGHAGALDSVAFSPDGTRLAAASADGALNVWQVAARPLHLFSGAGATAVAFSPDGSQLLSAAGITVTVWDAWTGQALRTLNLVGHTGEITAVAFSPDGTRLATGSLDRKAIIWDALTGQPLLTLAGHTDTVGGVAFSADGARLATASDDGTARIWNIGLSREWFTAPRPAGSTGRAVLSPDGQILAMGMGAGGQAELWDAASGQPLRTLTDNTAVQAVAFDPAAARLVTAGPSTLRLWNISNGQLLGTLGGPAGPNGPINAVAFSHDGARLATAGANGTAQIFNTASGVSKLTLTSTTPLLAIAFSPDDKRLAMAGQDGLTRIVDSITGQTVLTLTSTSAVRALANSPDGARLATATEGGITQIWDTARGQVAVTLSGHTSLVMDVAYSTDGKRLATASRDGTAKLWDPNTGQLLLTLQGSGRGLNGVAFSPDGTHLYTSGDDGLRAYVLRIEDLVALAHTRVTRAFTLAECQQYLHLSQCSATVSK